MNNAGNFFYDLGFFVISKSQIFFKKWLSMTFAFLFLSGCSLSADLEKIAASLNKDKVYVEMTSLSPTEANQNSILVNVKFSESVTGIDESRFEVINGSISGFSGSDKNYSFTLIPSADGPVSVTFPEGQVVVVSDSKTKDASSAKLDFTVDRIAPTVALTTMLGASTTQASIPVNVTFSESVTGLTPSDFIVSGGSATVASVSGAGSTYLVMISAGATSATITLTLPAGTVQDVGTNVNTASNTLSIVYTYSAPTTTVPTAVLSSAVTSPTYLSTIPLTLTFSERNT